MATVDELYDEAEALKEADKRDEAIAKFRVILEQDDAYVLAHLALALLCGQAGEHEDAVRHGEKACEIEPDDAFNFTAMSATYRRAFQLTGNQEYLRKAEDAMGRAHSLQTGG